MRQLFILILLSLCIGFAAAQDAAQDAAPETTAAFTDHPARVVGNINGLNVRSAPAIEDGNIIGRLSPGQQVHVIAREGDWQQVRREDGLSGWAHSDYLIDLPPRQLGETRLFRIDDEIADSSLLVNAELRHIGPHSYIYVAENPRQSKTVNADELRDFGKTFDEYIFPETYELWQPDPRPSQEGDERIVILLGMGYRPLEVMAGFYHRRGDMPAEPHPHSSRTGFFELTWHNDFSARFRNSIAAHELQHLIQHHFDRDETGWIHEGLSVLTSAYLDYSETELVTIHPYQDAPYSQLNTSDFPCGYGPGFIFTAYILERLGLAALRDFARRTENGLAALDAVLSHHESGLDTETFFADFVLAKFLRDPEMGDGQFGFQLLQSSDWRKPYVKGRITRLPTLIQNSLPPYATDYFEFDLPATDQALQLELGLQFPNSTAQDGWLQLAQVVAGEVILQRFRASEIRGQMMQVDLHPQAEQAFLAISPFRADARYLTANQPYTIRIHLAGSDVEAVDYAAVESSLAPRSVYLTTETEQITPILLTLEITAIVEDYILNYNKITEEGKTGVYVSRVQELIAAGADLSDSDTGSLLARVVMGSKLPAMLAALLAGGADPNNGTYHSFSPGAAPEKYPGTAINYAVFKEREEQIALLLQAGATVNINVLKIAAGGGNTRIIRFLLDAYPYPERKANIARQAATIARREGYIDAAQMLESVGG